MSTAQKRQARVQTAPISMRVAVPAFQHSPMFGHFASSQTVARRCSRTVARTASNALPAGIGARSQFGLRPTVSGSDAAAALMPSLIAVKPCGVRYLSPLRGFGSAAGLMGMPLKSLTAAILTRADAGPEKAKPGIRPGFAFDGMRQRAVHQACRLRISHISARSCHFDSPFTARNACRAASFWPFFR